MSAPPAVARHFQGCLLGVGGQTVGVHRNLIGMPQETHPARLLRAAGNLRGGNQLERFTNGRKQLRGGRKGVCRP